MKKNVLILFLITFISLVLTSCKKTDDVYIVPDEPRQIYYSLNECCSDGTNYITISSVKFETEYKLDNNISKGHFMILSVDTNLDEEEFKEYPTANIKIKFKYTYMDYYFANYFFYDGENNLLVYDFTTIEDDTFQFVKTLEYSVESKDAIMEVSLQYHCFFKEIFFVDGTDYNGRIIRLYYIKSLN